MGIYIGNKFSGIAINGKIISNQRIKNQTIIPTIVAFENDRKDPIIGENIQTHFRLIIKAKIQYMDSLI